MYIYVRQGRAELRRFQIIFASLCPNNKNPKKKQNVTTGEDQFYAVDSMHGAHSNYSTVLLASTDQGQSNG